MTALAEVSADPAAAHVSAIVLFDYEEIGSRATTGADGAWLGRQLERSVLARGGGRDDFLRAVANSLHVSADMTHATHPNYPDRHEPGHWIALGGGPVIKVSANVSYGTTALTQAAFLAATGGPAFRSSTSSTAAACAAAPPSARSWPQAWPCRRWTWATRRWACTRYGNCPARRHCDDDLGHEGVLRPE